MILRETLELSKCIDNCRLDMYELAKDKGFSDPEVVKISQKLDRKIFTIQKFLYQLRSM